MVLWGEFHRDSKLKEFEFLEEFQWKAFQRGLKAFQGVSGLFLGLWRRGVGLIFGRFLVLRIVPE